MRRGTRTPAIATISRIPYPPTDNPPPPGRRRRRTLRLFGSALFYTALVCFFVVALTWGTSGARNRDLLGYSVMEVLSSSMSREYPVGSLIFIRQIEPSKITKGDNITYFLDEDTKVTHKVVGISHDEQGKLTFTTKGTENPMADKEPVAARNVIGKVVGSVAGVGNAVAYLKGNWAVALLLAAALCGIVAALTVLFSRGKEKGQPYPAADSPTAGKGVTS